MERKAAPLVSGRPAPHCGERPDVYKRQLQKTGHEVTVVELLGRLANESFGMYREALIWEMEKCGMAMLPKTRCLEITPTGVKAVSYTHLDHDWDDFSLWNPGNNAANPSTPGTSTNNLISEAKAKEIALAKAPSGASVVRCHLDWDDGRYIYEIKMVSVSYTHLPPPARAPCPPPPFFLGYHKTGPFGRGGAM